MSLRSLIGRLLSTIGVAAILAGCATGPTGSLPAPGERPVDISTLPLPEPRPEPLSKLGNPVSYEVMGERYHVLLSATDYSQTGVASWYGRKFHGRTTASGEIYDMYEFTAAHKTLPLPSYVRVTNLENGRQVIVRVNDRGPFHGHRLIDLSYAAAKRLGMIKRGTARVRIQALTIAGQNVSEAANPELYLQTGAFSDSGNANEQVQRLKSLGIGDVFITPADDSTPLYRVRIGPFSSPEQLATTRQRLSRADINSLTLREH